MAEVAVCGARVEAHWQADESGTKSSSSKERKGWSTTWTITINWYWLFVEVLLILYRRTMYSFHLVTKNSEIILIDGRPPLSSQLRSLTALLAKNTGSVRYFLFVGDTGLYKIPNSVAYHSIKNSSAKPECPICHDVLKSLVCIECALSHQVAKAHHVPCSPRSLICNQHRLHV